MLSGETHSHNWVPLWQLGVNSAQSVSGGNGNHQLNYQICTKCSDQTPRNTRSVTTEKNNEWTSDFYISLVSFKHCFWLSKEKMQQEIDTVIGQERSPCMEDRKSLPFTDAVLHEIQRFMDLIPMSLPHYTLRDVSFRGYIIPKVFCFYYRNCIIDSY